MRGRGLFATAVVTVTCALLPAGAGAATTVGMTMVPTLDTDPDPAINPFNCLKDTAPMADTATLIQYQRHSGSTPGYTVPFGGVITSWAHTAPDPIGFAETAALKILRPAGGTQFTVIGQSALETLPQGGPHSFKTQIPVQAGDYLGLFVQHGGNVAYCQEQAPAFNTGDLTREIDFTQNSPNGTVLDFTGNEQNARLSLSTQLEPDADGDGLGDETQDSDVGGGGGGGGGAADNDPPETTLKGKKKVETDGSSAKVKFKFKSDEEGATFECRLDAKKFKPCTSPKSVKVKLGSHVFTVQAIDAAGNVDPTSAAKLVTVVPAD